VHQPLKALVLLVKFSLPLKVLPLLHHTARVLLVKFCLLPKVLVLHHEPPVKCCLLL
jgi:hypothetical protein